MVVVMDPRRRTRAGCGGRALLQLFVGLLVIGGSNAFLTSQDGRPPVLPTRRAVFLPCRAVVARPTTAPSASSKTKTALSGMWSQDEDIEGSDRIKACVPYLLPLMDGDQFGHYIYSRIPTLGAINEVTIGPLASLGHNIPFLSLGLFVALTLGTRFNTDMNRNLRFSAQQAALIDLALIIPELVASCFAEDPLPQYIAEPCANFVWYAYMSAVIYSVYTNLRGRKPDQLPFISERAEMMVGPF